MLKSVNNPTALKTTFFFKTGLEKTISVNIQRSTGKLSQTPIADES